MQDDSNAKQATSPELLLTKLMSACGPKTELEWFAARKIEKMQTEIAELRKDCARLDWLADPGNNIGIVQLPIDCVKNNIHSLRAAIDAAMGIKDEGDNSQEV